MARLPKERKATVMLQGEEVLFTFREPTNEELNDFLTSRFELKGKGPKDTSVAARCDFFDLLLVKVENLEDEQGEVTPERKDRIPSNWKQDMIMQLFEATEINVKN